MSVPSKRLRLASPIALGLGVGLALVAGCDQPAGPARTPNRAGQVAGIDMPQDEPAPPVAPVAPEPPAEPKRTPLIGAKTTDIGDAAKEKQNGGVVAPKQISKDPFRVYGNAYVSIIGQASIGNIKHAIDLYQATTGEYPKTHEEFMENIITNKIALPALPPYQKYVYDVNTHELGIWEYPELKNR